MKNVLGTKMTQKIFWTSDLHIFHARIIQLCKRPFSSAEEMTETIIENYNKVVGKNDIVYNLGDVVFDRKLDYELVKKTLKRLNGTIHVIMGNHDNEKLFAHLMVDQVFASLNQTKMVTISGQQIWLSHYPHVSWPSSSHGSWMLHGHCHGSYSNNKSRILDVGVDSHNFFPVSFEQVREIMTAKEMSQEMPF